MGCRITDKWTYRGFRTIILENSMLRATLLPESGAKLWEFIYKPADRELLWHNPRIEPRPPVFYGDADAWWCGGLDECIPTGHPCNYKGDNYPYLGETWTLPWEYELTERGGERVSVHLWRHHARSSPPGRAVGEPHRLRDFAAHEASGDQSRRGPLRDSVGTAPRVVDQARLSYRPSRLSRGSAGLQSRQPPGRSGRGFHVALCHRTGHWRQG